MIITFTVSVTVEKTAGPFAGRDEITEAVQEAIDGAIPDAALEGIGANGTSDYEVTDHQVISL